MIELQFYPVTTSARILLPKIAALIAQELSPTNRLVPGSVYQDLLKGRLFRIGSDRLHHHLSDRKSTDIPSQFSRFIFHVHPERLSI